MQPIMGLSGNSGCIAIAAQSPLVGHECVMLKSETRVIVSLEFLRHSDLLAPFFKNKHCVESSHHVDRT